MSYIYKMGVIMAFFITDECIDCGTCQENCPNEAIVEEDGKLVIDRELCISCGMCESSCPMGAIIEKDNPTPSYKISDDCLCCGSCQDVCLNNAIYEADGKYEIDEELCIGCGSCAEECPAEAIGPEF